MATVAAQAPARIISAVSGTTPLSDSLTMAINIKAAITAFASDSGLQMLSQLIDQIPELKKDIVKKDRQIQELSAQLATEKKNHSADQQKQLQVFTDVYDAWRDEKAKLQSTAERRKKDSDDKSKDMTTLQATLDDLRTKGKSLEAKFKEKVSIVKEKEQKIEALEKLHQKAHANAEEYSVKLGQSRIRVTQQETILGDYKAEHDRLKIEYAATRKERDEVLSYSAPMHEVNLGTMAKELEGLWKSANTLVGKFFRQDLPGVVLQNDWDKLRDNSIFKHQIPLPQSNSKAAKDMRVATILGILARLIDNYIFQPSYLLEYDSGFRQLLSRQATVDQNKERFARGTILSMFPAEEESKGKERIDWVMDDLFRNAGVRAFLANDAVVPFEVELEKFLMQAQGSWRSVQYSKERLEPSFHYSHNTDLSWNNLDIQVAECKEGKRPAIPVTPDGLEDEPFVIFPRVYLMGAEPKSITTGAVLRKSQLRAAAQEIREKSSQTPFAQPGLTNHRTRPTRSRSMSISSDAPRGGPTKKSV